MQTAAVVKQVGEMQLVVQPGTVTHAPEQRQSRRYHTRCGVQLRRTLLALVAVAACESGTAPNASPVEPRYRLLRIDSLVLPVVAFVTGTDTTFLTMEVVTLREDRIATFVREYRTVGVGVPIRTGRTEFGLTYVRSNGAIAMDNGEVCVTIPRPFLRAPPGRERCGRVVKRRPA